MYYCGRCIWDGCPDKAFCEKQHEDINHAVKNIGAAVHDEILQRCIDELSNTGKKALSKMRKRHVSGVHKRVR